MRLEDARSSRSWSDARRALATARGLDADGIADVLDREVLAFEAGRQRDDMALLAAQAIVGISQGRWTDATVVNPECRARFTWT